MSEGKHTPFPWLKVNHHGLISIEYSDADGGGTIADFGREADADLVMHRLNSHDQLVEALKKNEEADKHLGPWEALGVMRINRQKALKVAGEEV